MQRENVSEESYQAWAGPTGTHTTAIENGRTLVTAMLDDNGLDALIYPSTGAHTTIGTNMRLSPNTGMPAITVPMGAVGTDAGVNLEFLGRDDDEGRLLGLRMVRRPGRLVLRAFVGGASCCIRQSHGTGSVAPSEIDAFFDINVGGARHTSHRDFVRLVAIENIHRAEMISQSTVIPDLNKTAIDTLSRVVERGVASGDFRTDVDALDLHMMISAYAVFSVANRYTFRTLFDRDLLAEERHAHYRSLAGDMVVLTMQADGA